MSRFFTPRRKRFLTRALCVFSLLVFLLSAVFYLLPNKEERDVYVGFIRLHILANSDSDADQALKLKVRDAVLDVVSELTASCTDVTQAKQVLAANADRLASTASAAVKAEGADYPVSVLMGKEYYPTRGYDGVRLPAGVYESVRVCIGSAQGHNWWCILFPPLCLGTAAPQERLVEAGFTAGQIRVLTDTQNPRYVLKFRILELFAAWKEGR